MVSSKLAGQISVTIFITLFIGFTILSVFNGPIKEMAVVKPAPDFTFPSLDGSDYSLSDDDGRVRLITFMYTKCTLGCSIVVSKMDFVLDLLEDKQLSNQVKFIAIDFDYKYDNMADLQTYSDIFDSGNENWEWLLGDAEQTNKTAFEYGFPFNEINSTLRLSHEGEVHAVQYSHPFLVYIIDKNGQFRAYTDSNGINRGYFMSGIDWNNQFLFDIIEFLILEE